MANYRQPMHTASPRNMRDYTMTYDKGSSNAQMPGSIDKMPIAMAYVPWQQWKTVYDLNKSLEVGTIFPELDLPFLGMRGDKA